MSAVSLPFDPALNFGPRPAPFAWPAGPLDHGASPGSLSSQDFSTSASINTASEPSLTPPSVSSSLTSSPPRSALTAEQRELKRLQDRARRDSRLASRLRRVSNQSTYLGSPSLSPIPDMETTMTMPSYTTSMTSASLLSESLPGSAYMHSYHSPLQDPSQAQMFPTSYTPPIHQGYGMPMEYSHNAYGSSDDYSARSSPLSVGQEGSLMYQMPAVMTSGSTSSVGSVTAGPTSSEGSHVRVVQSRPKPRCWEHGCNGRQFSTFSNLLRHQREKSGQATKASCPNCGAEFTRTTARNGHMQHDKCKRRN